MVNGMQAPRNPQDSLHEKGVFISSIFISTSIGMTSEYSADVSIVDTRTLGPVPCCSWNLSLVQTVTVTKARFERVLQRCSLF
jgi:hypothetical protein